MSERIDVGELEKLSAETELARHDSSESPSCSLCIAQDALWEALFPAEPAPGVLAALLRAIRAAARINELVGTETEQGQAEAWEELDAALAPFDFGTNEAD